jgi:hypothetical protein
MRADAHEPGIADHHRRQPGLFNAYGFDRAARRGSVKNTERDEPTRQARGLGPPHRPRGLRRDLIWMASLPNTADR